MFQSEQKDSESGLVYLRARYYDPTIGRFASQDPMSGSIGDPASQNGYNYANNDPVNLRDPLGLAACGGQTQVKSPTAQVPTKNGVFKIGISGSVGFGIYTSGAVGVAIARNGTIGIYASGGGGDSTGLNTGAGVQFGYNKGTGASALRGTGATGDASAAFGPGGGFDISQGEVDVTVGVGIKGEPPYVPFEGHVGVERTGVHQF
jgi:RHS repeat-associated protein